MKRNILIFLCLPFIFGACACSKSEPVEQEQSTTVSQEETVVITSSLSVTLSTDKAFYSPGESVSFKADYIPTGAKIRYRHLSEVVETLEMTSTTWTWNPPSTDFQGYLVEIYQESTSGECILGTIAVDVSSDWKRFPRYGFVAAFGSDKTSDVTEDEMEELCRYHINGVQFQDWHYKHHWPLPGTPSDLLENYTDIANRSLCLSSVQNYIASQHKRGMLSIFYNLCYGVLDDAQQDGVSEDWYIVDGAGNYDFHSLPSSWKSDIYLVDPSNSSWLDYMGAKVDDVYAALDFDGYQIDQLGSRGTRYTKTGSQIDMTSGYATFINSMKARQSSKRLIMNAVENYGLSEIASTGNVDFAYNELWAGNDQFHSLLSTIAQNQQACPGIQTVFAAYMNYGLSNSTGSFNDAGVILTDAVMFAIGGSHLELGGDHMLCNEYFPSTALTMKSSLKTAMIRYYDFLTAYENLLRGDGGSEITPSVSTTSKVSLKTWSLSQSLTIGSIATYSKKYSDCQVLHLLNLIRANSTSWRDYDGDMPTPSTLADISLSVDFDGVASKVWCATPDYHGGAVQALSFTQSGRTVSFTLPNLKYWTMIVVE